ncbi:hypothetical protein NQ318_000123 [Aromia moschata]|uniref:Uncharacterized protein n=1 Tax=Aromia moschata TaxID=1265417 RepID=A0AAV8X174_9CUCU|nr:hypothetical protein NQ318_000123 [Aromia moschata]
MHCTIYRYYTLSSCLSVPACADRQHRGHARHRGPQRRRDQPHRPHTPAQNEKAVSICLEERDACELVLVLRGYFKLEVGQNLPVDQDEAPPPEDLAPPYLSQHKVVPEKWSYISRAR